MKQTDCDIASDTRIQGVIIY